MKRMISVLLATCLVLLLAVPALAGTEPAAMDAELSSITLHVKEILQVDDDYTDFYSDYWDNAVPQWYLSWSDDGRDLSVTCRADGTITDVYFWRSAETYRRYYGYDAAFPAMSRADAREQAEYWLGRLCAEGETARIDTTDVSLGADGAYTYGGVLLINGLDSPIAFTLRLDENGLLSYYRSDGTGFAGDIPSPAPAAGQEAAEKALADAVKFELYYVSNEDSEARLQYVPVGAYTIVDAQSGEAVDVEALYDSLTETGMGMANTMWPAEETAAAEMDNVRGAYLTEMELDSISNYSDVLDAGALDAILREYPALALEDFSQQRCSYALDSDSGAVTASLRYTAEMTEENLYGFAASQYEEYRDWGDELTIFKYFEMDAKTGELRSVSTGYPLWEREPDSDLSDRELEGAAEAFLAEAAPERYARTALCGLKCMRNGDGLIYAQVENGYFYPENYLRVSLNRATGTVESYDVRWDEDVTFASAEGIIDEAAALAAYAEALDVVLGYAAWPVEAVPEDPVFAAYWEQGYAWVETLRLAWYYGGLDEVSGVDALTGSALRNAGEEAGAFAYGDIAETAQREKIEALAEAGIGFSGGQFLPEAVLTQRDAVILLLQSTGYAAENWTDEQLEEEAVWLNLIASDDWRPEETVTRMDFLRMIIGASCYGDAAGLSGAWAESFSDVPAEERGYAAIALALGMVSAERAPDITLLDRVKVFFGGEKTDTLRPADPCTRAEAAEMLYGFMSR